MKKILLLSVTMCYARLAKAQETNYVFYHQLQNVVNPAAAGAEKGHTFLLNLRNHLQGSDNHQLQSFNTTHRITNNVKLGAQVVNQKVFVQRQTAIYADFAYGLAIDSVSTLQLGLKAGGDLFNIDATRFRTFNPQNDPYLQGVSGKFQPNVGVGVYYQANKWYAGLSVPNLLASDKTKVENEVVTSVSSQMVFYAQGGYYYTLTPDFTLRPSLQASITQGGEAQANITAALLYRNVLDAGLTYRSLNTMNIYALFNIPKYYVSVGYGFETVFQEGLNAKLKNTHEFVLKVTF